MTAVCYWKVLMQHAMNIPSENAVEKQSWLARNICELILFLAVFNDELTKIDDIVSNHDFSKADKNVCLRLRELRSLRAPCPNWYPIGENIKIDSIYVSDIYVKAAKLICEFGDSLNLVNKTQNTTPKSPMASCGQQAVFSRSKWRPTCFNSNSYQFLEIHNIPSKLVRRGWMNLPMQGPTMLVVDQQLNEGKLDIWWGIHNGAHLDHLSWQPSNSAEVEFGNGLIVAEALAVSLEMLAAAETLIGIDNVCLFTIREGLIERAGRLPLPKIETSSSAYLCAMNLGNREFYCMPTVAAAYIVETIRLIAHDFKAPTIPHFVSFQIARRWDNVANSNSDVSKFMCSAKSLFPYG